MSDNTTTATIDPTQVEDDFLASVRLDQSYTTTDVAVTRPLLRVPIRKPAKTDFFRIHPEHHLDCYMLAIKETGEYYVVTPAIAEHIAEFVDPVRLRYGVTRQGVPFVWPIKLPKLEGRPDPWRLSAAECAARAESRWLRIKADMNLGAYQPYVAVHDLGDPQWPETPWPEVIKIALAGNHIGNLDHPLVCELLGQV